MHGIEFQSPIKVGDMVYVVEAQGGKPVVSIKGRITKKLKYKFEINSGSDLYKYPFNEVYKQKKEAQFAIKYWYEPIP